MRRNFLWPAIGALIVGATLISFGHREWRDLSYLYVVAVLFLVSVVGASLSWSKGVPNGLSRLLWLTIAALSIVAGLAALRYRPVQDISYLYSLVTIVLSALVIFTVISEFYRGGRVIHRQTGNNLLTSMAMLLHRNTRRYGGYIVHFGVVVVMIGFAGTAFNQDKEQEMAYGDKMTLGSWTLLCRSYTQEDKPNYGSEWAIIDVFKNGKQVDTLYPERRFYKASQQMSTLPQIRRSAVEDLYLIYEGINQDTGRPIIKAHLNPLVMWIWIGAWIMIAGTIVALIPSSVPVRFAVPARIEEPATVGVGD